MSKGSKISVTDVCFYLDAQRQDGIDRGSQSYRSGQVLALREKLLSLSGSEFDVAMKTLSRMVDDKKPDANEHPGQRKSAATELYKQARSPEGAGLGRA